MSGQYNEIWRLNNLPYENELSKDRLLGTSLQQYFENEINNTLETPFVRPTMGPVIQSTVLTIYDQNKR